jgi:hypothetical protein
MSLVVACLPRSPTDSHPSPGDNQRPHLLLGGEIPRPSFGKHLHRLGVRRWRLEVEHRIRHRCEPRLEVFDLLLNFLGPFQKLHVRDLHPPFSPVVFVKAD